MTGYPIPNFVETSIALVSKDDTFARENQIAVLNVFISDFSLRTDLIFPFLLSYKSSNDLKYFGMENPRFWYIPTLE